MENNKENHPGCRIFFDLNPRDYIVFGDGMVTIHFYEETQHKSGEVTKDDYGK